MDFITKNIAEYSEKHTSEESPLLQKLNRETWEKVHMPRMLSGHLQGRILSMISSMIGPNRILEVGTYTGYSAICLAEGLSENGKLITIDKNEELEEMVRNYLSNSEWGQKIDFLVGDASDVIGELDEEFDLVFIDADKENYLKYYHLVFPLIRKGGIIIADNVLWSGKVVINSKIVDKDTESLKKFNKAIQEDARVENLLLPVRDGLMVIRKL